jgi:signal transduction histidine kinase
MSTLDRLRRAANRRPHTDVAVAALLYAVTLVTTAAGPAPSRGRLSALALVMAGVACGSLVVRHRWPVAALVASVSAAEGYLSLFPHHEGALVLAAPLIALYTFADSGGGPAGGGRGRRRNLAIGGLAIAALAGAHIMARPSSWLGADNLALAALGALALAAGDASRSRRAYTAEVELRARRAELGREQEARRRVTEERLRIARDLHDVLGHQLALITVQAGVADHLLDVQPGQSRQALGHIRQAGRTALEELRDTIGLLREPGEPDTPTEPTASLSALDDLVASFRRSGLRVEHTVGGRPRPLAAAADLTAYRVVQESLTNVCKHAGGSAARLRLAYKPDTLRITVDDDGPGREDGAGRGTGHGITGMRERVTALGGTLHAGRRPDGGFRVDATLPSRGATT